MNTDRHGCVGRRALLIPAATVLLASILAPLPSAGTSGASVPAFTLSTFPVGEAGVTPYNAPMIAVMDHEARFYQQCCDTEIVAYTGESAVRGDDVGLCPAPPELPVCFITPNCICEYRHPTGGQYVVNGNYVGALFGPGHLSYDGHAGYDYRYDFGVLLVATADGMLCKALDDPINGRRGMTTAWEGFHSFYIDHGVIEGAGYASWYLHADDLFGQDATGANLADLAVGSCAPVVEGQVVATVGNAGTFLPHLHFETRTYVPADGPEHASQRGFDAYGWTGTAEDPLASGDNPQAESRIEPTWLACGNGRVESGEQCDDGGTLADDCCSSECQLESNPPACPAPTCAGDCNADGAVAVNELVIGVRLALGSGSLSLCPGLDRDDSGTIAVSELVAAVGHALDGCPIAVR